MVAAILHVLFWIQLLTYPSVRQWSMQWVYAYLGTDLFLLVRFFLLYVYRWWPVCLSDPFPDMICLGEAILDNYLNLLQSYILLALNICRYLQIVHNHDVYSLNRRAIMIGHVLIYSLPLLGHVLAEYFGLTHLKASPGDTCDLLPVSWTISIAFLLLSYFVPVILTLAFLSFSLAHVRNTDGIRSPALVDARHKYHRQLAAQSGVFYSLWLLFWSPHVLLFPFVNKRDTIGMIAQVFNYISITIDPIVISALDVRLLKAWKLTGNHVTRYTSRRLSKPVPIVPSPRWSMRENETNGDVTLVRTSFFE